MQCGLEYHLLTPKTNAGGGRMRMVLATAVFLGPLMAGERLALRENWFLQSSAKVREKGVVVSQTNYVPLAWYQTTVPTTVLAALVANGVYPDPYYGLNLKSIPGFREGR